MPTLRKDSVSIFRVEAAMLGITGIIKGDRKGNQKKQANQDGAKYTSRQASRKTPHRYHRRAADGE
jgi:hypothetical protein